MTASLSGQGERSIDLATPDRALMLQAALQQAVREARNP